MWTAGSNLGMEKLFADNRTADEYDAAAPGTKNKKSRRRYQSSKGEIFQI
jgi:hypothetical protein